MSDDGNQIIPVNIPYGATLEVTNRTSAAQLYEFDFGAFGSVSFSVPIGGSFRYRHGNVPLPRVTINGADIDIEGLDNVVRINKKD